MTKLFFNLYLFIAVSLILLSALLNSVFFDDEQNAFEYPTVTRLLTSIHQTQGLTPARLDQMGLTYHHFETSDLAMNTTEMETLASQQAVVFFDHNDNTLLYFQRENGHLLEITLPARRDKQVPQMAYNVVFYTILAGLIALWLWPLWRDIRTLKLAALSIDASGQMHPVNIEKRSVVYPIAVALNELANRVSELLNTQRELTGAVAHEFRTPLSRLKFALAANQSSVQAMNDDIDELEKLVQEMLSYTSMESQQPELNITEIPLLQMVKQRAKYLIASHTMRFAVTYQGEDIKVLADAHYVERAFDNLFNNACRYASQQINVRIEIQANRVQLSVEDDGPGVATENRLKVFEPFFRPDQGRDRKRGGAGLGLAIVKRIMLWHGGTCGVSEASLGGARFYLQFTEQQMVDEP